MKISKSSHPPDSAAIRAEPHHGRRVATSKLIANTACQSPGEPNPPTNADRERAKWFGHYPLFLINESPDTPNKRYITEHLN